MWKASCLKRYGIENKREATARLFKLIGSTEAPSMTDVGVLVKGGAMVGMACGVRKATVLLLASYYGHLPVVTYLLDHGSSLKETTAHGKTALISAASSGQLEVAQYLVSKGAKLTETDSTGLSPLHCAALCGSERTMTWMIERGAAINSRSKDNQTPLHCATIAGRMEAIQLLLAKGASIWDRTIYREGALLLASLHGHLDVVKHLLQNGAPAMEAAKHGENALHYAALGDHAPIVKWLLETQSSSLNVNSADSHGWTVSHIAAVNHCPSVSELLKTAGANALIKDVFGASPEHSAQLLSAVRSKNTEALLASIAPLTGIAFKFNLRNQPEHSLCSDDMMYLCSVLEATPNISSIVITGSHVVVAECESSIVKLLDANRSMTALYFGERSDSILTSQISSGIARNLSNSAL